MDTPINQKAFAEYLRFAKPRLICRVEVEGNHCKLTPFISQLDRDWDEIIDEGYDPDNSPLGCPVYWRIVKRGGEQLYCSTFRVTRREVFQGWGESGLAYCDPVTGTAAARLETFGSLITRKGR
jgi:hypothetical protein